MEEDIWWPHMHRPAWAHGHFLQTCCPYTRLTTRVTCSSSSLLSPHVTSPVCSKGSSTGHTFFPSGSFVTVKVARNSVHSKHKKACTITERQAAWWPPPDAHRNHESGALSPWISGPLIRNCQVLCDLLDFLDTQDWVHVLVGSSSCDVGGRRACELSVMQWSNDEHHYAARE
jgi:hypothetical protein